MEPIHEEKYRRLTIKIYQDDNPCEGPRDWDNFGKMICFHPRYNLGDKHDMSKEELLETVQREDVIALPLFLLDHSGLWMRTGRFECDAQGWDTSHVGYIYVEHETIKKEFGKKKITEVLIHKAEGILEKEVETYSDHLEGNVWGYVIEDDEKNHIESCWGYYGNYKEHCLKEAKSIVDHITEKGKANAVGQYLLPNLI